MGLLIDVYRGRHDCTNNGVSGRYHTLLLLNAEGPFKPHPERPAVIMQQHIKGCLRIVPATLNAAMQWVVEPRGYMMGGNFGGTSDSRFSELAEKLLGHRFYGAVAIHDRVE